MNSFHSILITDIEPPVVVHSEKGRVFQMKNRSCYGLSLCISGQITYTMNEKTYVSNQNNAVLLPKGGTYSLYGDQEGLFPLINFQCKNFNSTEIIVLPLENPQACTKEFAALKDLFLHTENRLKIYSIFYELLNKVSSRNSSEQDPLGTLPQYIEKNISNLELSNTFLAKKIGISEVYLRKLFVAHLKTTPKQYILELRIQKAKQLLVDTRFTVTEIAEACGFSSLYHFCRVFKDKTGMTPTEYARLNKRYQI